MKLHSSIEERVNLFKKYYRFANERPLLGFFVGSEYPLHRYNAPQDLPKGRSLVPDDFNVATYLDDCDRLFDEHEACGGDDARPERSRCSGDFVARTEPTAQLRRSAKSFGTPSAR